MYVKQHSYTKKHKLKRLSKLPRYNMFGIFKLLCGQDKILGRSFYVVSCPTAYPRIHLQMLMAIGPFLVISKS